MEPLDLQGAIDQDLAENPRPPRRPAALDIVRRFPDLEWLAFLPPADRRWYKRPPVLARLMAAYPEVRDDEWLTLLG
jgi:hypothetical protein